MRGASGRPGDSRAAIERRLRSVVTVAGREPALHHLDDRMNRHRVPGVSVAVITGGAIEWSAGYGVRDGDGHPVTPTTIFQAASISKVVAACAALALVDRGELQLDRDVNHWLRRWRVPANRFTSAAPVTLRRLLDHSAGVSVPRYDGYPSGAEVPTLLDILRGAPPSNAPPVGVSSIPGREYRYSGGGFCIVELLIEEVTGTSFADAARDLVFGPAEMTASVFELPRSDVDAGVQPAAAHDALGTPVAGGWHTYPEAAAAGLWSTASDVASLAVHLQRSLSGESRLLTRATVREAVTPSGPGARGLGVDLSDRSASRRFRHAGTNRGYASRVEAFVDRGEGVVVMTNSDSGHALIGEIVAAVAASGRWPGAFTTEIDPPSEASDAVACAGTYRSEESGAAITFDIGGGDGGLVTAAPYGHRRMVAADRRQFVDEDTGSVLTFDADGAVPGRFDLVFEGRQIDRFRRDDPGTSGPSG